MNLQIFEQRYLSLVKCCLKESGSFGVVAIREGREVGRAPQVFHWGVEVRITDWCQQPNGLLGITIAGARAFTLSNVRVKPDQLMVADVQWRREEALQPLAESHPQLQALYQQLAEHPMVEALGLTPPLTTCELGWQLCLLLPFPLAEKVALLALPDPAERLVEIEKRVSEISGED